MKREVTTRGGGASQPFQGVVGQGNCPWDKAFLGRTGQTSKGGEPRKSSSEGCSALEETRDGGSGSCVQIRRGGTQDVVGLRLVVLAVKREEEVGVIKSSSWFTLPRTPEPLALDTSGKNGKGNCN